MGGCPERGGHGDGVWMERVGDVDFVTNGEENVESLNKIGVAVKKT